MNEIRPLERALLPALQASSTLAKLCERFDLKYREARRVAHMLLVELSPEEQAALRTALARWGR